MSDTKAISASLPTKEKAKPIKLKAHKNFNILLKAKLNLLPKIKSKPKNLSHVYTSNKINNNKIKISSKACDFSYMPTREDMRTSLSLVTPHSSILLLNSKLQESDIITQAQATHLGFEEINKLIKKLTLSFNAHKSESYFSMSDGLFEGSYFYLKLDHKQKNLNLSVNNLSACAHGLISSHKEYLRARLKQKEINLESFVLNS